MVVVDFGIDMTVDLDDVLPSVVVIIDKPATPRDVTIVNPNPGGKGDVAEGSVAVVVVQVARVIGKVGLEDIEPSVTVVVRDGDAHPGLFVAVVVVGATRHDGDIREGAVMVVLEQNAGFGIH